MVQQRNTTADLVDDWNARSASAPDVAMRPCRHCAQGGGVVIFATDTFCYGMIVRGFATVTSPSETDMYWVCRDEADEKKTGEQEQRDHGRRRGSYVKTNTNTTDGQAPQPPQPGRCSPQSRNWNRRLPDYSHTLQRSEMYATISQLWTQPSIQTPSFSSNSNNPTLTCTNMPPYGCYNSSSPLSYLTTPLLGHTRWRL